MIRRGTEGTQELRSGVIMVERGNNGRLPLIKMQVI